MANAREIRDHIDGIKETQKITKAMYLISSAKLSKAKAELDKTRPYFSALQAEIKRIFRTAGNVESKYFYPDDSLEHPDGTFACLVITADKGLAGEYNQNVIKETNKVLEKNPDTKLFVVGEYGRHYFSQKRIPIERSFLYTAQNPTMYRAREICDVLLEEFDSGAVSKILVIYTDLKNGLETECRNVRLIPFHKDQFRTHENEKAVSVPFDFAPSVSAVLNSIMRSYISGYIYSALVDSFCSEQQARMTAMDGANRNAEKLLKELSLQYNRVRQGAITMSITEVSAGAKAQRKHHKEG
ncbi:MAG: ATP synthase F1 subunit gamma [Lachnospiraceae bacterium]|nr:ATP synthase F1 subunit gamma [Lachnospiraceae bacterium]